ncbi:Nitroreductase [Fervidobacterium changbaicum]|uniref:Nitroreductase n=1 Tax=Fervidobacterium changbaicum TaxID=310769 RepID=A0ABX5QUY7_9BACT|nr:nitroreductase family protein [Fervidobacterium changbaicum]QAV33975.1 nitroreductase [Fervidobacterium changbaicum]SDH25385.1 Nitroreductase [Fervidobacterium changbaicum]
MELREVILKRRSIRKFKQESVPFDLLKQIAKYSLLAPSGRNSRPVDLVIVTDRDKIQEIKRARQGAFSFLETAPACIVVAANEVSSTWLSDASIVATYIQLLCVENGLGSCWGHAHERFQDGISVEAKIKEILHIPEGYRVLCVIGIGYPDEQKDTHVLEEVDEKKIHISKW